MPRDAPHGLAKSTDDDAWPVDPGPPFEPSTPMDLAPWDFAPGEPPWTSHRGRSNPNNPNTRARDPNGPDAPLGACAPNMG